MAVQVGKKIPGFMKSPEQVTKERKQKSRAKFGRKVKKIVTTGNLDVPKTVKKVTKATKKATKKVTKATKKVAKSTGARIASVASKAIRSPVGKFGPLGAAVTLAYYAGEEFFPNKASAKTTTTKKPTAKSVPSSFGSAFKKAYKDNPGGTFTYKGKKYKAVMKKPAKAKTKVSKATIIGQGGKGRMAGGMMKKYKDGSSISFTDAAKKVKQAREDKKFYKRFLGETDAGYKARIAKKEKLANKKPSTKLKIDNKGLTPARTLAKDESKISKATMMGGTPFGMSVDEKKKAKKYDPTKANRAGQRMGQRKAGGMMKKMAGGIAKKYNKGGLKDVPTNKQKNLGQLPTDVRNKMGFKMSGGMAKKKMMGGGMMQYNKGTGKKGVTVQARGCGQAVNKRKTRIT